MLKKSISFSILLFLCLSAFGTRTSVAQDDLRIYFIGNSLSNDLIRSGGFEEIASSIVGESNVLSSQHIQCSTPLTGIIASAIDEPNTNPHVPVPPVPLEPTLILELTQVRYPIRLMYWYFSPSKMQPYRKKLTRQKQLSINFAPTRTIPILQCISTNHGIYNVRQKAT